MTERKGKSYTLDAREEELGGLDTWPKILRWNCERYGDGKIAMRYKDFGIWKPYTWKDYYENAKYLALGLLSLDFEPGDKIIIIGDNAPQWYYAELAAQANHGASVGIYTDLTPPEIKYIAEDSEIKFAVVEDQEQADKFLQIEGELPLLKRVIYWDPKGLDHYDEPILAFFGDVLEMGREYERLHPGLFEQNVDSGKGDDICALVYTSGTTGAAPKGAMHSYNTMRVGAENHLRLDMWQEDDDVVSYLPPAWMTEQWYSIGCMLISGATLNFPEKPETTQSDIREIGPNLVFYGAGMWEALAAMVQARMLDSSLLKRFTFNALVPIGHKMATLKFEGKPNLFWKALYGLAWLALFRPLRSMLGMSHIRICYTAGSLLSPDALKFWHALKLPLKSLYGSTEGCCSAGALSDNIKLGTCGPPMRGCEIRITDEREIIIRTGGLFRGYYRVPEKTAEVVKDGWFYSGDGGFLDEDGQLVFLDRLKDMGRTATGAIYAPQYIESRLKFSPFISNAMVIGGEDKDFLSVVIIIDYENVGRWAESHHIAYTTFTDLSQKTEVYGLVGKEIERVNRGLPQGARVTKFVDLHKELDPDEAELTRTRKLRRKFLSERYKDLIDFIYSGKEEFGVEAKVRYRDGREGVVRTTIKIKEVGE